jgi:hypothetical protein
MAMKQHTHGTRPGCRTRRFARQTCQQSGGTGSRSAARNMGAGRPPSVHGTATHHTFFTDGSYLTGMLLRIIAPVLFALVGIDLCFLDGEYTYWIASAVLSIVPG